MKQALHIFGKDVRRLWPQVLVVAALFAVYGLSPEKRLAAILVAAACWTLGANVIQEDAPAQESPFWLTRPHRRSSLLGAKILFLFVFVFLPLMASGILIEARAGVDVLANVGALLAFDVLVSCWLILPAVAAAAVTGDFKTFVGAMGILGVAFYAASRWFVWHTAVSAMVRIPDAVNFAGLAPMILAGVAVPALQYALRKKQWSRRALTLAAMVSAVLMPLHAVTAWSVRAMNPAFDPAQVRVSFDETAPLEIENDTGEGWCFNAPLKVDGLPAGDTLRPYGAQAVPRLTAVRFGEAAGRYRVFACMGASPIPDEFRMSMNFAVLSIREIARIPVRPGILIAGNAGRCQMVTPFYMDTQLRCELEEPPTGSISAGLVYPGFESYADSVLQPRNNGPLRLSPVSMKRFDGVSFSAPGGWPFDEAMKRTEARFVLRAEQVVGTVRSELVHGGEGRGGRQEVR